MIVKTTDVWTEQYQNHYDITMGAFIDGVTSGTLPFDRYKVVLNCNCYITQNGDEIIVGNKHNAIVFFKENKVVRLAVLTNKTDVLGCVDKALNQNYENVKLSDLFKNKGVKHEIIDLKEKPDFNQFNNLSEMDIGSCDRMALLNCLLSGNYTESETTFGNYDSLEYDFEPNIKITYKLKTDKETFDIHHKGAFINKTKTRAIIIQSNGSISLKDLHVE